MTATPNHGLDLPTPGGSATTWGDELNAALTLLDGNTPSLTGFKADGTTPLPFTGAQAFDVGTVLLPGIYFDGDPNSGLYWIGADNIGLALNGAKVADFSTTSVAFSKKVTTPAAASGGAGLNIGQGTTPSVPGNGDLWIESTGLYARVAGATVGPFSTGGGVAASAAKWTTARTLSFTGDVTGTNSVDGSGNVATALTIGAGKVTATMLASDAVTTAKILDANVTTAKIADSNVTTAKIAASAVTLAKMENRGQGTFLGRKSGAGTGAPQEMSAAEAQTALGITNPLSAVGVITGSGSVNGNSTGISGASRTNTGRFTVSLSNAPTLAAVQITPYSASSMLSATVTGFTGTTITVEFKNGGGTYTDPDSFAVMVAA